MNSRRTLAILTPVAFTALGAGLALLAAGPLNPPGGAVSPSYKTLAEIEPRIAINSTNTPGDADSVFRISQPGSYYLTGNIAGVAGKHGIWIAASGVTLDLNGFALTGVSGSLNGVVAPARNVAVLNGTVSNWGGDGVGLASFVSDNCRVERVFASYNGGNGIDVAYASVVANCSALANTGAGIYTVSDCTIMDCTANRNQGDGFGMSDLGNRCLYSNCTSADNTGNGFELKDGSSITNCTSYSNNNHGILAGAGCTITNCTVTENFDLGITVGNDSTVTGCTARANGTHGILVTADCIATGNSCNGNGTSAFTTGAGIYVSGANNRIEANNCSNNDRGIEAAGTLNLIIRNTASSNSTNYLFVANNRYGPILDITGATAAVNGNSAASTTSTTDPHANFRY